MVLRSISGERSGMVDARCMTEFVGWRYKVQLSVRAGGLISSLGKSGSVVGDVDVKMSMVDLVERDDTEAVGMSHSVEGAFGEDISPAGGKITEPVGR